MIITVLVISLFIFFSWVAREYADELSSSIYSNIYGELAYFLISILTVVIAGISSLPLISIANTMWGSGLTVILTATAWAIGSLIAFPLSYKYGEVLAFSLINKCDFEDYRK